MTSKFSRGLDRHSLEKTIKELAQGVPAPIVARKMQRDWWVCRYMPEPKLVHELRRLRAALTRGGFPELVLQATGKAWSELEPPNLDDVHSLEALVRMAKQQEAEVHLLFEIEKTGSEILPELSAAIARSFDVLERYQELRFELGLDVNHAPEIPFRRRSRKGARRK